MLINFAEVIRTLDGKTPLMNGNPDGTTSSEPLTLGGLAVEAILRDGERLPGAEKVRLFTLAQRVYKATKSGEKLDLPVEDVTMIKTKIGDIFPVLIAGQALPLLDPPPVVVTHEPLPAVACATA